MSWMRGKTETYDHLIHNIILAFGLIFALLICGCPVSDSASKRAGTETGNPGPSVAYVPFVSALPAPISGDNLSDPFVSAILEMGADAGAAEWGEVIISPQIAWPLDNMLLIAGANRGMQVVDLAPDGRPVLRGTAMVSGSIRDICLLEDKAYLLADRSLHPVNLENRDQPSVEASTSSSPDRLRISSYNSHIVRVSSRADDFTQLDAVAVEGMTAPVTKGVVLPIGAESEMLHGKNFWLKGRHPQSGRSYLLGVDLERLLLQTEILDLSGIISDPSHALPGTDPDSPIFAITEVPGTDFFKDDSYTEDDFNRIMQTYGIKMMELLVGIWMEEPLFIMIADHSLYVYNLTQSGALSSIVPIAFLPESFATSGSTLVFSYFEEVGKRTYFNQAGERIDNTYAQFYYNSFDFSNPSTPLSSGEMNAPGATLSLREDRILTLDFSWDEAGNFKESIKSGQIVDGKVIVSGEYTLPARAINHFISGTSVIAILSGDAEKWSDLIRIVDFSNPGNPLGLCEGRSPDEFVVNDTCGLGVCGSPNNTPSSCEGGVFMPCTPGLPTENPESSCSDDLDNDCDGLTDIHDPDCTPCLDKDSDGYGSPGSDSCPNGSIQDCDDNNPYINPRATEVCDGVDNDCNGQTDGVRLTLYLDLDRDGYGDSSEKRAAPVCSDPPVLLNGTHYVGNGIDCNDLDNAVHPAMEEAPGNGIDDNCDGIIDEESTTLEPNRDYVLRISPTPQKLYGAFLVAEVVHDTVGQLHTSVTFNDLPGVASNPIFDNGIQPGEPSGFGSSIGGDGYVGTIWFTTNSDGTAFAGTRGPSAVGPLVDYQYDTIFNVLGGDLSQKYQPDNTASDSLSGTLGPKGSMRLSPNGRLAAITSRHSSSASLMGAHWNNNPDGERDGFSTEAVTNALGTIRGNRIRRNEDGMTFSVTLVSAGTMGAQWNRFVFTPYFEVWNAQIVPIDEETGEPIVRNPFFTDDDHDGFSEAANDCNDANPNVNPAMEEITLNNVDDDCNPDTPDGDLDGDGFTIEFDCDDNDGSIHAEAAELQGNGLDDNCNGLIDEPVVDLSNGRYVLLINPDQPHLNSHQWNLLRTYFDFMDSDRNYTRGGALPGTNGLPSDSAGLIYFTVENMPSNIEMDSMVDSLGLDEATALELKANLMTYDGINNKLMTITGKPRTEESGRVTYPGEYRIAEFDSYVGSYTHYIERNQFGGYEAGTARMEFFLEGGLADFYVDLNQDCRPDADEFLAIQKSFPYNPIGTEIYYNETREGILRPEVTLINEYYRGFRPVFIGTTTIDLNEDGLPDDPDNDGDPNQKAWVVTLTTSSNVDSTVSPFEFIPYGHVYDGIIVFLGE